MKKITALLFCALFAGQMTSLKAQELRKCYTDEMVAKSFLANPQLAIEYEQRQLEGLQAEPEAMGAIYYIPVVFHILHNYGAENISDAQVKDAVNILTRDFRMRNADTVQIVSTFQNIKADTEIEFRLATKDPNGNCTNGIDRIVSSLTYSGDDDAKLNPWPRNKYLNIWVVGDMASATAAAYAYLPGSAPSSSVDGILVQSNYVGSIGTGSNSGSRVLTHEIGHFLNLLHVWGSGNSPGVSCGNDYVSDTPQSAGWTSCNLTGSTCNSPAIENVQNYMEYAYCDRMFTAGQGTRMRAALNNSAGQRNQLWTSSNLTATGALTSPPPACAPKTDFGANYTSVCAGSTVLFSDLSWNGTPSGWNWTFTGGTPAASTSSNPSIVYNTPGTYSVSLSATNSGGNNSLTKTSYIEVLDATVVAATPSAQGFEDAGFPNYGWSVVNPNVSSETWQTTIDGKFTGDKSVYLNNYASNPEGHIDYFLSPLFNFATSSTNQFTFRVSYAQTSSSSTDQLNVYLSTNCGASWNLKYTKSGASLATRSTKSTSFKPTAASEWRTESINVNAFTTKTNVRLKFEFISGGGNNIYLDDIVIMGTLSDGMPHQAKHFAAEIIPNPISANSFIDLSLENESSFSYTINDVLGKELFRSNLTNLSSGEHQIPFQISMPAGIYFVNFQSGEEKVTRKIIVSQ